MPSCLNCGVEVKNMFCSCKCSALYRYAHGWESSFHKGHQLTKGKKPWNIGLTKETDERLILIGKKISKSNLGKPSGRRDKTYEIIYGKDKAFQISQQISNTNKMKGIKPSSLLGKRWKISHKRNSHRKGKTLEQEYGIEKAASIRYKYSKSHEGKFGVLSSNWQGGLSYQEYPEIFLKYLNKIVKKRDKICKLCGVAEGKFHVHHIDYNKRNNCLDNLILLCKSCHMKTNGRRKFWTKLFQFFMIIWIDKGIIEIGKGEETGGAKSLVPTLILV